MWKCGWKRESHKWGGEHTWRKRHDWCHDGGKQWHDNGQEHEEWGCRKSWSH